MRTETTEMRQVINHTQELVIAAICDTRQPLPASTDSSLAVLTGISDEEAQSRMGAAGQLLKRYVSLVTSDHPDTSDITKHPMWVNLVEDVKRAVTNDEAAKDRLNKNYNPLLRSTACPKPRLIGDSLKRHEFREVKGQVANIGLKSVYMLGENGFYGKPDNFQMYVRNSPVPKQEMETLQRQQKMFQSRGLSEVAHAVQKRMQGLESVNKEEYLGFRRITPAEAAVVSARMHGLRWHDLHFLTVPFKYFNVMYWTGSDKPEEDKAKDEMKRLLVMKDRKMAFVDSVAFTYQPRLYPLGKFSQMPKLVGDIVTAVESFSELNNCPIFDYYWVMVPSICVSHPYFRSKDRFKVYVRSAPGKPLDLMDFATEQEAAQALDTTLVMDGCFLPVVLGEREGKCYFLCLWK